MFNRGINNDDLYAEYSDYSNLPSFVSRGEVGTDSLYNAENLFKENKYKEALDIFQSQINTSTNTGSVYIYTGLSQIELEQYKQAENTFDTLIESNLLDAEKGYWYKALLYLKQDNHEKAISILKVIVSESLFNNKKATELLNKLDD